MKLISAPPRRSLQPSVALSPSPCSGSYAHRGYSNLRQVQRLIS